MVFFQRFIFFFQTLFFDISGDDILSTVLTDGVHEITLAPKLPTPKLLLHFGAPFENFPGQDALYHRDNLCYAVRGNTLNQEMNVVLVGANLQKADLISFLNLCASFSHNLVDRIVDNNPTVFRTTDQMVKQHRYVMALMYKFAVL